MKNFKNFTRPSSNVVAFGLCVCLIAFLLIGYTMREPTVSKAEFDALQEELTLAQTELASIKSKDSIINTKETTPQKSEISYTLDELVKMSNSTNFIDILTVATYPETPESLLLYISTNIASSNRLSSKDEFNRLALALMAAPNSNASVISGLIVESTFEILPALALSELNDELSLYLIASKIVSDYKMTSLYDTKLCLYEAATNCTRNPAVTKKVLLKLLEIDDEVFSAAIQLKLDSMP